MVARAGFFYAPSGEETDRVQCAWCGVRLARWAPGDDPWQAHRCRPVSRPAMGDAMGDVTCGAKGRWCEACGGL